MKTCRKRWQERPKDAVLSETILRSPYPQYLSTLGQNLYPATFWICFSRNPSYSAIRRHWKTCKSSLWSSLKGLSRIKLSNSFGHSFLHTCESVMISTSPMVFVNCSWSVPLPIQPEKDYAFTHMFHTEVLYPQSEIRCRHSGWHILEQTTGIVIEILQDTPGRQRAAPVPRSTHSLSTH